MSKIYPLLLGLLLWISNDVIAQNTCATAVNIAGFPFNAIGQTTAGSGDDYDETMSCGSFWMTGDDYVYQYVNTGGPTELTITLANTSTYAAVFVLDGCPDAGGNCLGASTSLTTPPPPPLCITLPTNGTYYIIVSSFGSVNQSVNFDINITSSPGTLGSSCTTPLPIASLPFNSTGNSTQCYGDNYDFTVACAGNDITGNDFVYSYTTATTECISAALANTVTCAGLFLFDGCPDLPATNCLATATGQDPSFGGVTIGPGTYYFVISSNPLCAGDQFTNFDINITTSAAGLPGSTCGNPQTIASLPYNNTGLSTCCYGDEYDNTDACASPYMMGDDYVFEYTSAGNECLIIDVSNTTPGAQVGVFLLDNCPDAVGAVCMGQTTSPTGNPTLGATISAPGTYYIVVSSTTITNCTAFDIDITSSAAGAAGTNCANPVVISGLPYTQTGEGTQCMANDYTNADPGSCGSFYEASEDKVYEYVKTTSSNECITVTLSNTSDNNVGFQIYDGCPDVGTTNCIGSGGPAVAGTATATVILPNAGTYYIIADSWTGAPNFTYDIDVTSNGPGQPNDLPCNATALTDGVIVFGDNSCSGSAFEPAAPACWSTGSINTVWYSFVAPASGQINVRTFSGTLANTQIALYSGACGSLTNLFCNVNMTLCGNNLTSSEIQATGLTPGNTYYIAVDGNGSTEGIFSIVAVDGTTPYPVVPGQDCSITQSISACNQVMTVGNPGFSGTGNVCDFSGAGNCTTGELNSAWYTIDISAAGNLSFVILPNDGGPATCGAETDYDFVLWKTAGTGATNCAAIATSGGGAASACNYSFLGVTGANGAGTAPAPYNNCFDPAFAAGVPVVAGDQFILCVQNFSGNTSGFSLDFSNTPVGVINYAPPTSVTWGGNISTTWNDVGNWGNCNAPACATDGVIVGGPLNMPVITGTENVNNLTINPGAILTLGPGATLNVCGDLFNLGSIVCDPTSTINMVGTGTQEIGGNLTGANSFGNLTINKTTGVVNLNGNLEMTGTFTTSNATSIFNTNGRYISVGGDFNNSSAATTFTNVGTTGTLEFTGTALQQYNPGGVLTLNNVTMNNTGAGTNLNAEMILGTSGNLTLLQGPIITGALRVTVNNTAPGAVSTGNASSYVQGNLRRFLSPTGSFDFPVGEATAGYQRANINFTGATTIPFIDASFSLYAGIPGPLGNFECAYTYNLPALDNGRWTLTAGANPTSGTYDATLYNTNYTNAGSFWTVMRNSGSGWALQNGVCDPASTVMVTRRTGMNGFSDFGVAQADVLAVDLLAFRGEHFGDYNLLTWETEMERNNAHFDLERSADGVNFEAISRIPGNGDSDEIQYYSDEDHNLQAPIYHYRLRQVDFDGAHEYSEVVTLWGSPEMLTFSGLYPNPANQDVNIGFYSQQSQVLDLKLMDAQGKLVRDWSEEIGTGAAELNIPVDQLADGLYFIKVQSRTEPVSQSFRFVKKN